MSLATKGFLITLAGVLVISPDVLLVRLIDADTLTKLFWRGLLSGLVTFWFSPLSNIMSRKHEYEADDFARVAMQGAGPLIAALRKLASKNLSNMTPHAWFSGFYYSHPTLVERERAMVASD